MSMLWTIRICLLILALSQFILKCQLKCKLTKDGFTHFLLAFPENKPFDAADGKLVSTSNHWDKAKSNEVSVTFTLSSAAAKVLSHGIIAPFVTFSFSFYIFMHNYQTIERTFFRRN